MTRRGPVRQSGTPTPESLRRGFVESAEAFGAELDYVYRAFRRLGAQPAEAEDLAQDVFVVVWRRWSEFQPERPLRPWLAGIANHVARDYFRRRGRRELATEDLEQEDLAPGPEDQLASARARQLALQALEMMPERHRSILIKHEIDGASIREIAEENEVPFFTAAARIRRARERFAKAVKRVQGGSRKHLVMVPLFPRRPRWRWPLLAPLAVAAAGLWLLVGGRARGTDQGESFPAESVALVAASPVAVDRRSLPPPRLLPPANVGPGESAPAPAAGLPRGLVAAWRFEDGPGSTSAVDSSGQGHPCLLHELDPAIAWVPGKVGGAVDLGRTGWLECPLPEARAGVPFQLSVAAWVRRVGSLKHRDTALFTRQLPSWDQRHLFWFGIRDARITVWSWSWSGWTTSPAPDLTVWTHLAFVHSGGGTAVYVNGVRTGQRSSPQVRGEGLVQSSLTIGAIRFAPDPLRVRQHFDGLVDEALVYDRELTDVEVATLARL